jgi:methylthioribose-1-phosphate isomerase
LKIENKQVRTIWAVEKDKSNPKNPIYGVEIIDQTRLPHHFEIKSISTPSEMVEAIKMMRVRGAPLIGAAAAFGIALATQEDAQDEHIKTWASALMHSRPTAVNLAWALNRMTSLLLAEPIETRNHLAWIEAQKICDEDVQINQSIGQHGLGLIKTIASKKSTEPVNILTHCNAGWLATVDWGTALSPIYHAFEKNIPLHIWVDETRPRNQGANLTAWELLQHGIPHTIISDNAGGHLMQHGQVDLVIVGADRITRRGDVCNKIGTYLKALAAFDNEIPFYVAAPSSSIDLKILDGREEIEIEMRGGDEIHFMTGLTGYDKIETIRVTPKHSHAINPAFDVTPAKLISGIITEYGIASPHELQWMIERHQHAK